MNRRVFFSTSTIDGLAMGGAALVAAAIWLPWPTVSALEPERANLRFAGRDHPSADVSNLAKRPLLQVAPSAADLKPTAAPPSTEPSEQFVLRGIARIGPTDVAVFEDRKAGQFIRVQRGQAVGGWHLVEVANSEAVLKNQDGALRRMAIAVRVR